MKESKEEISKKTSNDSIISKAKKYIGLGENDSLFSMNSSEAVVESGESQSMLGKFSKSIQNTIEVERNYTIFFLVLAVGLGFISFSMFFLPFVLISPQKFVSFFSIGSLITLSSFIFIYGTTGFFGMLFSRERRIFSIVYLSSVVCGFYYAFVQSFYLISLICAIVQMITLIIFTLSFIPGGESGISFVLGFIRMPFDNLIMKIKGTSYLPS